MISVVRGGAGDLMLVDDVCTAHSRDPFEGPREVLVAMADAVRPAEQLTGNRDFLHGTLDDVITGRVTVPADRPLLFSPFGLGVLDLAVGKHVYDEVARSGELHVIDDFFHELRRYG